MVFMGQVEPLKINLDEIEARLARPDYAPVRESLREIGIGSVLDLFSTFAGQKADYAAWLQGADINHDRDLRLQYIAGWGINSTMEDEIYRQMISYRRRPDNIFTGSPERLQALMMAIATGSATFQP